MHQNGARDEAVALFVASEQRMGVGCAIFHHSRIASTRRRRRPEVNSGRTPGVRGPREAFIQSMSYGSVIGRGNLYEL